MPVDDLQAMLPPLGVILPSGSSLQGGTLSANLGIAGPVDKLVITGPIRLAQTKLAGFNLASKMSASLSGGGVSGLTQLAGMGGKGGSIPFFIQGTTSDPKFVPDMQGMVGSQLKGGLGGTLGGLTGKNPSGNSPVDALGGLFGKKKKQLGRRGVA